MTPVNHPLRKKMAYVLALLTIVHSATFFLPITVHTKIDESVGAISTSYTLLYETQMAWIFAANFLMVLLAVVSLNRWLAISINIIVLFWSLLLFLLLNYMFVWDGQPIHARFSYGYGLNQGVLLALIVCSFVWMRSFSELAASKKHVRLLTAATLAVPVALIASIYMYVKANAEEPIMRSESYSETPGKHTKEELWDYSEAYGAYVTKYYSKDKPADTPDKQQAHYLLDSVYVTFYGDGGAGKKEFTEKSRDGKLDVEALLEAHSD